MPISEALGVLESKHCIAIVLALMDGPRTKMDLYQEVSKNPRMPDKIADLERVGIVSMWAQENRATMIGLTDKGREVALILRRIDEVLKG